MWIVPWDPFLMKKLLKSEICGSRVLFTGPTDVLKIVEKSKFSTTVHAQYMNSSLCLQLRVKQKKKKKGKTHLRIQRKTLNPNGHYVCVWIRIISSCVCVFWLFFFWFQPHYLTKSTVNSAPMHCSLTHKFHFSATFSLKMGPTALFTYLTIILLQCFQF